MFNKMIAAGFAALAVAGAAHANGVQDGTFTDGVTGNGFTSFDAGQSFGAWNVTGGSVDVITNYWQAPTGGGYSVDMNGLTAGTIAQTFTLAAGEYTVSFWLSGNPEDGGSTKSVLVSAGDASETFNFTTTPSSSKNDMGWTLETMTFTTAGETTLTFASQTGKGLGYSPYGVAVGGVSVSAVPEPASLGLLLAGLGMIGAMASRRRAR